MPLKQAIHPEKNYFSLIGGTMEKADFEKTILNPLRKNDIGALGAFKVFHESDFDLYTKIEWTHEFLDLLSFKLRESKCTMDKEKLSRFAFYFYRKTIMNYDYNKRFLAAQCKTLVTYHQNRKELDKAINVLEFLVQNGITEDDTQGFHIQLDDLYRHRARQQEKKRLEKS